MKTIKRIFLSVITLCLFSLVLTSCFTSSTKSIKIVKIPNSVFEVVGEEDSKAVPDLMIVEVTDDVITQIKLSIDENGQLVSSNNVFTITINGFDLSKVGSFTASVEYAGVVSYFDYQVVSKDSYFAGGDGSVNNPYQITTAEQFINMNKVDTTNKYFKLMNDISFEGVETVLVYDWAYCYVKEFGGTLEGNNKRLYNVSSTVICQLKSATIKNFEIIQSETTAFCTAIGKTTLDNVDIYGQITADNNASPYISYPGIFITNYETGAYTTSKLSSAYTDLKLLNCDNYTDIIGASDKVSAFFAFTGYGLASLTMDNCHNYGHIESYRIGFVTANQITISNFTINNCSNEGEMIQLSNKAEESSLLAAYGNGSLGNTYETNYNLSGLTGEKKSLPYCCSLNTPVDTCLSTLKVLETGNYYLEKNNESTSELLIDHFVVSLVVPVVRDDGTITNRPAANSTNLFFNEEGIIDLGLLATAYTYQSVMSSDISESDTKLFGLDWIYVSGNTIKFVKDLYMEGELWSLNNEKPYFVLYAYDEEGKLIAGSELVKLK